MLFKAGEVILLGQDNYRIIRFLGGGAVSDVYLSTWLGDESVDVIIKLPRNDYKNISLQEDREKLFQAVYAEADTLKRLNFAEDPQWRVDVSIADKIAQAHLTRRKRTVIALLDAGTIDEFPYLVQEFAPPEFRAFEVNDINSELKMLRIALATARTIQLAHSNRIALKDFEPNTKGDRIRVEWIDHDDFDLKIIDWNVSGSLPDDFKTDLLYLGCHLYRFFVGESLPYSEQRDAMPENLDLYPAWNENLNEGTRLILQGLLSRTQADLYSNIDACVDDLSWWVETLSRIVVSGVNPAQYLNIQIKLAFDGRRFSHALSLAHLALNRFQDILKNPEKKNFETHLDMARKKIEERYRLVIVNARQAFSMQYYEKAAQEYEQKIKELPPYILLTKEACAEMLFARAMADLSKMALTSSDTDIENKLNIATSSLSTSKWEAALQATQGLPKMEPVRLMEEWAKFEISLLQVKNISAMYPQKTHTETEWLNYEHNQLASFNDSLQKCQSLTPGLDFIPWILGELATQQAIYAQRKDKKELLEKFLDEVQIIPDLSKAVKESPTNKRSITDTIDEIKNRLAHARGFVQPINRLLQRYAQLQAVKSLSEQTWLVQKAEFSKTRHAAIIEVVDNLEQDLKRHEEVERRKQDIRDLIAELEYPKARQKFEDFKTEFKEFNDYHDIIEIEEKIKSGLESFNDGLRKLGNAEEFLQPTTDIWRNFEAARDQLNKIAEPIHHEIQQRRDLLLSFTNAGYDSLEKWSAIDQYEDGLEVIEKLKGHLELLDKSSLWADFKWKVIHKEIEWARQANKANKKRNAQEKREKLWQEKVLSRIDDYLAGKNDPSKKTGFTEKDFEVWDENFPLQQLPIQQKNWQELKGLPFILYVFLRILLMEDSSLTESSQNNLRDNLLEKYWGEIIKNSAKIDDLTRFFQTPNTDQIFAKTSLDTRFHTEKNIYNKYIDMDKDEKLLIENFTLAETVLLAYEEESEFRACYQRESKIIAKKLRGILEDKKNTSSDKNSLLSEMKRWNDLLSKFEIKVDISDLEFAIVTEKCEQQLQAIDNQICQIIINRLRDDDGEKFSKAYQEADQLLKGFPQECLREEQIRSVFEKLKGIVADLEKARKFEAIAEQIGARQGDNYAAFIKELTGYWEQAQFGSLEEALPQRCDDLRKNFLDEINAQIQDITLRLKKEIKKEPENISADLFRRAFEIKIIPPLNENME